MATDKQTLKKAFDTIRSYTELEGNIEPGDEGLFDVFGEGPMPKKLTEEQAVAVLKFDDAFNDMDDVQYRTLVSDMKENTPSFFGEATSKPVEKLSDIDIGKKAANGTLTIREALEYRGTGKSKTALSKIQEMGYDPDANWSTVSTDKFLRDLNDQASNAQFVELGALETKLRKLAAQSEEGAEYSYKIGYGSSGRAYELELGKAKQARGSRKPKAVPPAQDAIPAMVKGINVIPDPQTRAAVAFNVLVPLRPKEVAQIKLDDIDFETGKFKDEWRRVNKIRNPIELPEVALEILRDAKDEAVKNGQEFIFQTSTEKMTKAVNMKGGIKDQFKQFKNILGRDIIGASDIRKIVPSLMVGELKLGIEVSTIMGHASTDEMLGSLKAMTAGSYISPIQTTEGSPAKVALRGYHNMMAEVLNLSSLNELPVTLGVPASGLTSEGSPKIAVIPRGSDVPLAPEKMSVGTLTDADLGLFDEIRSERSSQLRLSGLKAEKEAAAIETELGEIDEEAIRSRVRRDEERKRIAQSERDILRGKKVEDKGPQTADELPDSLVKKLARFGIKLGSAVPGVGAAATFMEARESGATPLEAAGEAVIEESPVGTTRFAMEAGEALVGAAAKPVVEEVQEQIPEEGMLSGIARAFTGSGLPGYNSGGFINRK